MYIGKELEKAFKRSYEQGKKDAVRHRGKWIELANGKECKCSACDGEFDNTCNYDIRKDWNFCPNCGAKMDGD